MKTKTTRKDKKKKEIQEEKKGRKKKEMEKIEGGVIYILKLHAQGWESHI